MPPAAGDCGPTAHGALALALLAGVLVIAGTIIAVAGRPARALKVRRASVESGAQRIAEADPAFGPDQVRAAVGDLFRDVYAALNAGDRSRLGQLMGIGLLREWLDELDELSRQRLAKRVTVKGKLTVDYVGLDRPGGHMMATVIVRIVTLLGTSVARGSEAEHAKVTTKGIEEYWTLAARSTLGRHRDRTGKGGPPTS